MSISTHQATWDVLCVLPEQAQRRIRGLAVAGEDDDQVLGQRPARRITLPLFAGSDVALDQRIAQSLAVDLDLGVVGLWRSGKITKIAHSGSPPIPLMKNQRQVRTNWQRH